MDIGLVCDSNHAGKGSRGPPWKNQWGAEWHAGTDERHQVRVSHGLAQVRSLAQNFSVPHFSSLHCVTYSAGDLGYEIFSNQRWRVVKRFLRAKEAF